MAQGLSVLAETRTPGGLDECVSKERTDRVLAPTIANSQDGKEMEAGRAW